MCTCMQNWPATEGDLYCTADLVSSASGDTMPCSAHAEALWLPINLAEAIYIAYILNSNGSKNIVALSGGAETMSVPVALAIIIAYLM